MKTHTILASILFTAVAVPTVALAEYGDTTTFIGQPLYGHNVSRTAAIFDFPEDVAFSPSGYLYIADTFNHAIRKISPGGTVTTVAGNGGYGSKNGSVSKARFAYPRGIDVTDTAIFIADSGNNAIRKIRGTKVKTIISGLNAPEDVQVFDTTLYILDTGNGKILKSNRKGGNLTTVTSDLSDPKKMDISSDGQYAYIANTGTYQVIRVNLSTGEKLVIAGTGSSGDVTGSCSTAKFNNLWGIYMADDNTLYVSDGNGFTDSIKKITLSGCTVETFASDNNMVSVNFPRGIDAKDGYMYVVSTGISIIQKYNLSDADDDVLYAGANRFNTKDADPLLTGNPKSMVLSLDKNWIYFSENNMIRKMAKKNPTSATLIAGNVIDNYAPNDTDTRYGAEARFSDPLSITLSLDGNFLYVVDRNNHRIRKVDIESGGVSYLTGAGEINSTGDDNGYADGERCPDTRELDVDGCAYFFRPAASVLSEDGNYLYVADAGNHAIRRVTVGESGYGDVVTIAGNGTAGFVNGTGTSATFNTPTGITMSNDGETLYVADRENHAIRAIDISSSEVTTLVGTGSAGYQDADFDHAVLSYPESLTMGANGKIYFSEVGSQRIRLINFTQGVTKLVAGSGTQGYRNSDRERAKFNNPKGLLKLKKKLLVAELYNDTIRSISTAGTEPYTDPAPVVTGLCSASTCTVSKSWSTDGTLSITVEGSGFRYGAKGYAGNYEATVYVSSENAVVFRMPMSSMPAGTYTVRIQNSDGQYDDLSNALVITN
ncbi:MAG: hypothetical protein KIH62_000805 [Candidatus Kerfeldbacteria bacterium]|nr:hypothetical protein [Candidatus Kerfeldbacteria bacterium]